MSRLPQRKLALQKIARLIARNKRLVAVLIFSLAILNLFLLSQLFLPVAKKIFSGSARIFSLVTNQKMPINNDNGRVNILILGTGGAVHDGPNLTDTIIVASAQTNNPENTLAPKIINLISIPRDIYLDSLGGKINTAYSLGLARGNGLEMAKESVSEITGLPIHYAVRFDFEAFSSVIDIIGGIEVNVPTTFEDSEYPIEGKENDLCDGDPLFRCRYETIKFTAGPTQMDGKTALKFVRSRHAQDDEGTDFARAKRQQLVIKSIREKLVDQRIYLDLQKLLAIYNQIKIHVDTDFDPKEIASFLPVAVKFRDATIRNTVLNTDLLYNPALIDYRGWILLPKDNTWTQIHDFLRSFLEGKEGTKSGQQQSPN